MPELGVTIYENTKSKVGSKDFHNKTQKFSKNDYYSMLKETTFMGSSLNQNLTEKSQSDDFRNTLPLINQTNNKTMLFNAKSIKTNTFDTIKVSAKVGINLKNTFDDLELIPEFDELSKKFKGKNENVLKNKKKEENKQETLEEMNNFTLNILKNRTWGSQGNKESRLRFTDNKPSKPSSKEIEKEIGKIGKIPRMRK